MVRDGGFWAPFLRTLTVVPQLARRFRPICFNSFLILLLNTHAISLAPGFGTDFGLTLLGA